ncbi:fibronectin type III domain-containing protein [Flavobacterium sp. JP2137]|uniref:fibronectin type III domain-containing protein n=1 Tax=Flavobacterium sp. JP2137 TaxID=3414510 RepID=UPI003D2FD6E5
MKKHFHFFFSLFLLVQTTVWAQLYPVQLVPNINTPYTNKISDFSNSGVDRIALQVIPTDLTVVNRPVVLKLYFEGNGIAAQSASVLQGIPPMYINGGEILNLSSVDLAPYFQLKNIHGLNQNTYSQNLPDGMYQICFELYDGATRKLLSQKHCGMMYLMLNEPPLLNIPAQNEQVAQTDFTNILFSWTPRQLNAINISYTFELKELMDASMNANYAFDMAPLLYREEGLRTTVFLYDLFKPSLLPNKRYAWRVRAISHNGLAENSVFKNNGYSEVFTFKIDVNCEAPKAIFAQPQGANSVKISWQGVPTHLKYHLQYRKAQVENAVWFDLYSVNNQATISNLEAGYHYEFRVGGTCEPVQYGQEPSYSYSTIQQFQLENTAANSNFSCGLLPDINLINKAVLSNLIVTETFYAGDFPVKVLKLEGLEGAQGIYTGKGYIVVPYLADTKIAVTFENIQINTDYQLISGQVETTYNPDWNNVDDVEDLTGSGADGKIDKEIPFPIESIVIDDNGDIIIKGPNGEEVILPGGKDMVITDSTGQIWKISEDVKPGDQITEPNGLLSTDGKPSPENTNGVNKIGQATEFTAQGIRFAFENGPKSIYGWDVLSENGATAKLKKEYRAVKGQYLPYKAVAKGATDFVFAKALLTDGARIHTDSLEFKTDQGERIPFEVTTGGYLLKVSGSLNYAEEEILATVKQNGKSQLAGAFRLVHITPKTIQLSLVPTTAKVKAQLEGQLIALQAIYAPLAITLNIRIEEVFDVDHDRLKSEDKRNLTTYTKAQEAVINSYKGRASSDRYYLFVTGDQISDPSQQGYMRLQGQFGFVFNDQTRTVAHELAHGALALTHPFSTYNTAVGSLNTVMDYSTGTDFTHMDWKQVNDPKFKLYLFQGQSEGEQNRHAHLGLTPNGQVFDTFYKNGNKIAVTILVAKNYVIASIRYNEVNYNWNEEKKLFTSQSNGEIEIKRVEKDLNNRVNLFRSRGDGCMYDYVTVVWEKEDENESTTAVQRKIASNIALLKASDWALSPLDIRDTSCSNLFIKELLAKDLQDCNETELNSGILRLREAMLSVDGEEVVLLVNKTCIAAIRNLKYSEIEKLINLVTSQSKLKEQSELAILRLMNAIKSDNYKDFYRYLELNANEKLKYLITEMHDASVWFWTDKKNYTNFIGALVTMFNRAPASLEMRWPTEDDDFATRLINLNPIDYSSDSGSIFYQKYTSKYNEAKYDETTGNLKLFDVYKTYHHGTTNVNTDGVYETIIRDELAEVSPLTPIVVIPEKAKIPLIEAAIEGYDFGNGAYLVPAILLKYNDEKNRNDKIEKSTMIALDAITISASGGIALATKVTWIRRAWALAEVAGAVGSIGVNTGPIDTNSNLGKTVGYYNAAMGAIGVKNIAQGGYKYVKAIPPATKTLLKENNGLRNSLLAEYVDYKIAFTNLQNSDEFVNLTNEMRQQIIAQEKVFSELADAIKLAKGGGKFGAYSTKIDDFVEVLAKEDLYGDIASTFLHSEYRTVKTTTQIETYRSFGGDANIGGTFVTSTKGASKGELALLDEWNNSMRFEATINVPSATKMHIGKVGPQTSTNGLQTLVGGSDQIILPYQWDTKWVTKITDNETGKVYNSVKEFLIDFPGLVQ